MVPILHRTQRASRQTAPSRLVRQPRSRLTQQPRQTPAAATAMAKWELVRLQPRLARHPKVQTY